MARTISNKVITARDLCLLAATAWSFARLPPSDRDCRHRNRDAGERGNGRSIASCPFKRGATGVEVPFHNNIIGNFMVYPYRIETNLLQLFAHPENSGFSIIYVINFEVDMVAKQKQTYLVTTFCFFYEFPLPSTLLLVYRCSDVPASKLLFKNVRIICQDAAASKPVKEFGIQSG